MSATITVEYDDGSEIVFFNVTDRAVDGMVDRYLHKFRYSHKV